MKKIESLNLFRKNKKKTFSDSNNESINSCVNANSNTITLLNTNSHAYYDTLKINKGINLMKVYAVNFEDISFKGMII